MSRWELLSDNTYLTKYREIEPFPFQVIVSQSEPLAVGFLHAGRLNALVP